jgi:hypothetical protein
MPVMTDNLITKDELIRVLEANGVEEAERTASAIFLSVQMLRMAAEFEKNFPPDSFAMRFGVANASDDAT